MQLCCAAPEGQSRQVGGVQRYGLLELAELIEKKYDNISPEKIKKLNELENKNKKQKMRINALLQKFQILNNN